MIPTRASKRSEAVANALSRPGRGCFGHRKLPTSRLALAVLIWVLFPLDSFATNHLVRIEALQAGANGDPKAQAMEMKFSDFTQNEWSVETPGRARLAFFDAAGTRVGEFVFPNNPSVGPPDPENTGHSALMATQEFADLTGIVPDFIIPPLIQSVSGMVCFENNPANRNAVGVHLCLAYGNYQGPQEFDGCSISNGPPAPALESSGPQPLSLNRVADVFGDFECGQSNADFQLESPSLRNSAGQTAQFLALTLAEQGRNVFSLETFNGNGRRCIDCHASGDDFGLEPATIAAEFSSDPLGPLFVAEVNPALAELENPCLMRMGNQRGLILENIDGFANAPVFRGSPHLLNIGATGPFGLSGDIPDLSSFSQGAVAQHFPRTLTRNDDPLAGPIDFRPPTDFELDALEAFMSSVTFPSDGNLDLDRMINFHVAQNGADLAAIQRGRDLFFGDQAQCSVCHDGATLSQADGTLGTGVGNLNFNTGTVNVFENGNDGCLGGPGDPTLSLPQEAGGGREFSTPPMLGVAGTAPFFHDNSAETLLEAVLFYDSTEFRASPAGQLMVTPSASRPMPTSITFNGAEALDIVAFLDAISVDPNPGSVPTCSDELDNDADGLIDLADGDCTNSGSEESGSLGIAEFIDASASFPNSLFAIPASTISNPEPIMLTVDASSSIVGRTEAFDLTLTVSAGRFTVPLPSIGPSGSAAAIEVGSALGTGAPQEWEITQLSGTPGSTELAYRLTPTASSQPVGIGALVTIGADALAVDSLDQELGTPGGKLSVVARFEEPTGGDLRAISITTAESIEGVQIAAPDSTSEVNLTGSSPIFESEEIVFTTAGVCTGFPGGILLEHGNCSEADVFQLDPINDLVTVNVLSLLGPAFGSVFLSSGEDSLQVRSGGRCDMGSILAEVKGPAAGSAVSMSFPPPNGTGFSFVLCLDTRSNESVAHQFVVFLGVQFGSIFMAPGPPDVTFGWTLAPRCFGDFNGDSSVDNIDVFLFQNCFPCSGASCDPACDFDLDGFVNNSDALAFHSLFGETCEQPAGLLPSDPPEAQLATPSGEPIVSGSADATDFATFVEALSANTGGGQSVPALGPAGWLVVFGTLLVLGRAALRSR